MKNRTEKKKRKEKKKKIQRVKKKGIWKKDPLNENKDKEGNVI